MRLSRAAAPVAALVASLLFAGCTRTYTLQRDSREKDEFGQRVASFSDYTSPVRVSSGGRVLGELGAEPMHLQRSDLQFNLDGWPQLDFSLHTPCGWATVQVSVHGKDKWYGIDKSELTVEPFPAGQLNIYYDNRNGQGTALHIGELVFPIAANATGEVHLPRGGCKGETDIRSDQAVFGKVSFEPDPRTAPLNEVSAYVLDLTGQHCYNEQTAAYGAGESSSVGKLPPAHLQRFMANQIYFLQPPAASVEVVGVRRGDVVIGSAVRDYVWDVACN